MTVSEINPFIRYTGSGKHRIESVYSHAYDCRLIYLHEGAFTFECDGAFHEITGGTLLIWQPGMRYRLYLEDAIDAVILNFDFTHNFVNQAQMRPVGDAEYDPSRILERVVIDDCPALSDVLVLHDMHAAAEPLSELVREIREQKLFCSEAASAILKRILTHAARTASAGSVRMSGAVEQVIAFIRENYMHPITNREISERVNYHEFYVNKLMIKQTGMTLHRYLMSVRVQNAARLLTSTGESAVRVAELCGFTSASHFSSVFLRFTGETPAAYRRRHGLL